MKLLPMILVREFEGLDTSYRISTRRARNYWELLESIHNTFSKPWERYNAHLYFDNHTCEGQVSPSEWDAGGYFEKEFLAEGILLLYAHFEQVDRRMMEGAGAVYPYKANKEDDGAWHWGFYGTEGCHARGDTKKEDVDESYSVWEEDPYPPFPVVLSPDAPLSVNSESKTATVSTATTFTPAAATADGFGAGAHSDSREVITIDDSSSSRHIETGIIIGRAHPRSCRDPYLRPVARAILTNAGAVVAYVPSKYAKCAKTKGDVLISMKSIEYTRELKMIASDEIRLKAIRLRLQEKNRMTQQIATSVASQTNLNPDHNSKLLNDTQLSHKCKEESIIIGHAKAADPGDPLVIRAMLTTIGSLIAFVSGEDSFKPCAKGRAQIHLSSVYYLEEFAAIPVHKRSKVIKDRILEKVRLGKEEQADVKAK
ncbi:uncharacterized protein K460DRAFT_17588 [Cucurbitaria berberidis CBS 394.84]|uniref:Uncharacterized protein n=1 Tax=Cucurbitaria berberidis CBS 394.84 TaxID=1168544 RepID=A0A9P4LCB9_9PLEO|nr:uncharacterized protein K460DRAFT_17588 [Cucurbitaria berberidis CBS 394.84]KAF1850551.1 hypothetical protein K460DRAFT_17588 [Cucurbitaria berberidis CBS 394.84]